MTNMDRQYVYKAKRTTMLLCIVFFSACALIIGEKANGNDRGLIINGIVEISPGAATIFLWVLTAISIIGVLGIVFLGIVQLWLVQHIVLNNACLIVPRSRWSSEHVTVPFLDIVELSLSKVSGQRFFKIVYRGGKFTIVGSLLPKKDDFDEISRIVSQHIVAIQSQPSPLA